MYNVDGEIMIKEIDKNMKDSTNSVDEVKWIDLNNQYLRGLAFSNNFSRLDKNHYVSENVRYLQKHPSGVNITFKTNAKVIKIKAEVDNASYMSHMTAIGQIGFDLYYLYEDKFVFVATTKINQKSYEVTLLNNLDETEKTFRLYFPLYIGVNEAKIGINNDANLKFYKPQQEKIVTYGTSISQGGCATRPGMSYSNILDRMTNYEFINLGFSGSAHLEEEMAYILKSIPKKYLILEVEANNTTKSLQEKLPKFLDILKDEKIILISHFPHPQVLLYPDLKSAFDINFEFQKQFNNLTFIDGKEMLKEFNYDETVDTTHLTDLGFYFVAKYLKDYLK